MNPKFQGTPGAWLDPDDAPDLTDEDFRRGTWKIGDKLVSQEVAQAEIAKLKQSTRQPPPALNQTDA